MLNGTEIVQMAQELARHSGARQTLVARNIANADTPGYRATDVLPFEEVYQGRTEVAPRQTRDGHMGGAEMPETAMRVVDARTEPAPNGNSVSLETEMMKSAEVRQSHGMALAVYQASLDLMRTAIGRGR